MEAARHPVDVFLPPGQLAVRRRPTNIKTIVGSCVAVCLWDPATRIGGVNHYLLAQPGDDDVPDTRFGSSATEQLIDRMRRAGAELRRLEASVIGGGHPVNSIKTNVIGDENAAVAVAVLRKHGIRIVRRETGGACGRKLLFKTATGELIVRRLRSQSEVSQEGPRP